MMRTKEQVDKIKAWLPGVAAFLASVNRLGRAPRLGASGEMALLAVIGMRRGITQGPLRKWLEESMGLKMSTASLSLAVTRLMNEGLVRFGEEAGDRRKKETWLTTKGWDVMQSLWVADVKTTDEELQSAIDDFIENHERCEAVRSETVVPSVLMGRLMDSAVDLFDGRVVGWVAKEPEITMLAVLVELGMVTVDSVTGRIARVAGAVAEDGTGEEADL